ncbi:hypothetical protein KAFR_0A02330 [Kazachstania africana CBS 2517]|uniref:Transcriptional coactivator p15 (PC4) C-terminal domain-containing protein n=1 Tax=Kazachstania africana (strain ATCC 22294 / BCRC 22015 / CBS 2517 / CECT 1963 / NBRC 1671 / NRRL Y-8276) TaxID=1071382 RepID=H2AMS1_KAZAF|nr:hypothetical protein KAFR_0A02330 [Kazachstania africana CBS 2517]CCF55671.1 hypothetical protein KAFR_0A02330 [Kazachstania africana CBS 2517]
MSYYNRYKNRKRGGNYEGGNEASSLSPHGLPSSDVIFDLGKNKRVTVRQFRNINLIDIREYYMDQSTGEMKPGKKGISLTEDLYDELLKHRLNIDEALRRFGSKRPRTKTVRIQSDGEEDTESHELEGDNDDGRTKKQKIAPPTLLPHEENAANAKREANATLVIPGARKQEVKTESEPVAVQEEEITQKDMESSDDEESKSFEEEMNKLLDESSEEE